MTTALPNGSFSATLAPVEGRPNLIIDPPSRNWPRERLAEQEEFLALAPGLTLLRATWEGFRDLTIWMHDGTLRSPGIISGGGRLLSVTKSRSVRSTRSGCTSVWGRTPRRRRLRPRRCSPSSRSTPRPECSSHLAGWSS